MVSANSVPFLGGVETHVDAVARRLAEAGHEVTHLTTDRSGALSRAEDRNGYRIHRFGAYPRGWDIYISPALATYLLMHRGDYDVVHVQGVHTAVPPAALFVAQRAALPTVVTFHTGGHSSETRGALRAAQWRALAPLLRRADRLVAVCEYERDVFGDALGVERTSIALIRNGSEALPVDTSANVPSGDPLLVSVGRLEEYKGHHRILEAMPAILRRHPGARLVIVGRGPYEDALRQRICELSVQAFVDVRAFGVEERGALGKLIAGADVMCLLSEYEAHPVAVMEAIAAGTAALVADTSGMSELDRVGLVCAVPLDVTSEALADTALSLAARPRREPPRLTTWDECTRAVLDLYRGIIR